MTAMSTVMKISVNGQISLPASVRRKWKVDSVLVTETIDGLLVRPLDSAAPYRLAGKYAATSGPTTDELRDEERRADQKREAKVSRR